MGATRRRIDVDTHDFGRFVELLQEADDIGVLLKGHLWTEALLEYLARNKLERPDAIDWVGARFEHKLALCDALGAADMQLVAALRAFNRLRNRAAHEIDFALAEDEVKTMSGLMAPEQRRSAERTAGPHLRIVRELREALDRGDEIDIEPGLEWYPRVMTPARVRLYAFVVTVARELAVEGAFASLDRVSPGKIDSIYLAHHLNDEVRRMTGGIFDFQRLVDAAGPGEQADRFSRQ